MHCLPDEMHFLLSSRMQLRSVQLNALALHGWEPQSNVPKPIILGHTCLHTQAGWLM